MAQHSTPASMLKESLDENLEAAKFCIDYKKTNDKWKPFATGGCLGYPGGIILFSIIDSIGSYYRKNSHFKITINGKSETINSDGWEHFKILNSRYFNQNLSLDFIKKLYTHFRSKLTHNSIMGASTIMLPDNSISPLLAGKNIAFAQALDQDRNIIYLISLKEVYELCESAVFNFKKDIDEIVPNSKSGKGFN